MLFKIIHVLATKSKGRQSQAAASPLPSCAHPRAAPGLLAPGGLRTLGSAVARVWSSAETLGCLKPSSHPGDEMAFISVLAKPFLVAAVPFHTGSLLMAALALSLTTKKHCKSAGVAGQPLAPHSLSLSVVSLLCFSSIGECCFLVCVGGVCTHHVAQKCVGLARPIQSPHQEVM